MDDSAQRSSKDRHRVFGDFRFGPAEFCGLLRRIARVSVDDVGFCRFRVVDGFFHNFQGRSFREFRHDFRARPKRTRTARAPSSPVRSQYSILLLLLTFTSFFFFSFSRAIRIFFFFFALNVNVAAAFPLNSGKHNCFRAAK